jgi:predicted adenylyl cyclase CyaB
MIEVEKKFQPTEVQLQALLQAALFVKEKTMHDVYYDFPDYRLFKSGKRLRKRGDNFELKVAFITNNNVQAAHEFETEEDIKKEMQITERESLQEIVDTQLQVLADYTTIRQEYKKDEFVIDVDKMSFGVDLIEIELLVDSTDKVQEAQEKIITLISQFGIEVTDLPLKPDMYVKKMRPEIYNEIHRTG